MDLELFHNVRPVGLYSFDAYRKLLRYGVVAEAVSDEAQYLLLLPAQYPELVELEIIQMAGKGVKNREIGRKLFISEKTVKHHLSKIFKKPHIRKRAELKVYL